MSYHRFDLPVRASLFANRMHYGQTRYNKDKSPMMNHVVRVVELIKESGGSDIEIAAGWLHDIVEDTSVTISDIAVRFGTAVSVIVDGLTDLPEFKNLPTLERKMRQAERVSQKSDSVKRVKIADQISNVHDIVVEPPEKWGIQRRLDYAEGAYLVVLQCRGVSEYLDNKFEEAYLAAIKTYK